MTDNNLIRAADYIDEYGLNQDNGYFRGVSVLISVVRAQTHRGLPACALGAIYATAETENEAMRSQEQLVATVGLPNRWVVPDWSDNADKATVIDALLRAGGL